MIDRTHPLPITRQAEALGMARSTVYALPRPVSDRDLDLMKRIDRLHLEMPYAGSRMLRDLLNQDGIKVGRPQAEDDQETSSAPRLSVSAAWFGH
jgi:putative transposase